MPNDCRRPGQHADISPDRPWPGFRQQGRIRFIKNLPLLEEVAEKDPSGLEKAVSSFPDDSPRPGQPMHYTDEQIIRILEVACRNPEELGFETSHWSLNLLVKAVIKEGIVDSISAKTVSRFF